MVSGAEAGNCVMTDSSTALIIATWAGAIASGLTAGILAWTLRVAWMNLVELKSGDRVRRTTELFFNFYTQEYIGETPVLGGAPLKRTPYDANGSVMKAPELVKPEIVTMVHNYFEAVAALHWKELIDSELYFDSFAVVIVDVYPLLDARLTAAGQGLTAYSRIPKLYSDAKEYLEKRNVASQGK